MSSQKDEIEPAECTNLLVTYLLWNAGTTVLHRFRSFRAALPKHTPDAARNVNPMEAPINHRETPHLHGENHRRSWLGVCPVWSLDDCSPNRDEHDSQWSRQIQTHSWARPISAYFQNRLASIWRTRRGNGCRLELAYIISWTQMIA